MSDDNSKKPPASPKAASASEAPQKSQDIENKEEKSQKGKGPFGDFASQPDGTNTLSKAELTSIAQTSELTDTNSTRPHIRIVPVIQISSGSEQGRIISLAQYQSIVVGRDKECELRVFDTSCSRKHAEISVHSDGKVFIKDLNSTNGTKVNGKRIEKDVEIKINDGDRLQLGDSTILRHTLMPEQDARIQMDVYFKATRDRLTNAFNRHQFDEALDREVSYQKRTGHGLGIILFDVDHFKRINDSQGHLGGDEVLREIGIRVPTVTRNEDVFARIGGEEFGIIVRNDTLESMKILAERLRIAMEKKSVDFEGREIWFTISLGVSLVKGKHDDTASSILQMADDALYEAKNSGRNRVAVKTS